MRKESKASSPGVLSANRKATATDFYISIGIKSKKMKSENHMKKGSVTGQHITWGKEKRSRAAARVPLNDFVYT